MQSSVEYQWYKIEIVYADCWTNVVTKNKIYLPNNYQIPTYTSKILCITVMKLGNTMRVQILNSNFGEKDGLKLNQKLKQKVVGLR